MSKVTVTDLPKAEEFSSSSMTKVAGGALNDAQCEAGGQIWENFHGTANVLGQMGFTTAAVNLQEGGNSALFGNCTP